MTNQLEIVAKSPRAFRKALLIDADGGPRPLAEVCDGWQRIDFESLDPAWRSIAGHDVKPQYRRGWLERPRGHSKTGDIAAMVAFALFASRRRLSGVVAAGDADQAGLIRDSISKLLSLNDWLAKFIDVQRSRVIGLRDGKEFCELKILSADAPSSYGLTPDFIICDEVTHWTKQDLWVSLFSAMAKRSHCVFVSICNAGFVDSWQWKVREEIRTDHRWYFNALNGPQASWIKPDLLDEQRRHLPSRLAFERLWLNRWTEGSGDALEPDLITAALSAGVKPNPPRQPGIMYIGGLDIGVKRDHTALVVCGVSVGRYVDDEEDPTPRKPPAIIQAMVNLGLMEPKSLWTEKPKQKYIEGTGRVSVVHHRVLKPNSGPTSGGGQASIDRQVQFDAIDDAILEAHQRYGLSALDADPRDGLDVIQRMRKQGVPIRDVPQTPPQLRLQCDALVSAFVEKRIDLYDDPDLLADLRALRVVEKSYGTRLESPRRTSQVGTKHGDLATALQIVLARCRSIGYTAQAHRQIQNRDLVLWPRYAGTA